MLKPKQNPSPDQGKREYLKVLIPLLLSIFLIHLPIFYFITTHSFTKKTISEDKQRVVFVNLKKQLPIVDIQKPKVQKRPAKPSAQSIYDSSVKEETVSPRFSKSNTGSPPQPSTPRPKSQQTMQDKLKEIVQTEKSKERKKYAQRYQENKKKNIPTFNSSIGSLNPGNTDDYLPHYKVGNRTFLNTVADPRNAYYVELKKKFRFAWNPVSVLKRQMNLVSHGQMVVVWGVSVDVNGRLAGLTLIKSSGNRAYDYEANRTIKASSPFSSPPTRLIAKDGMAHMAWTFVVYL